MTRSAALIFAILFSSLSSHEATPPWPLDRPEPTIATDADGNKIAIWEENELIMTSESPANGSWSIPFVLSNPTASCASPQIEIDSSSGDATAMWVENQNMKAASKPFGCDWERSHLEPTLVDDPAGEAAPIPKKRLAIVLEPLKPEGKGRVYPGAFAAPDIFAGDAQKSEAKAGANNRSLFFKPRKGAAGDKGDPFQDRKSMSTNAIDAPTGKALSGMQMGFAVGQAAPTDGAVISGQVGVGESSVTANTRSEVSMATTDTCGFRVQGTTTSSTTPILGLDVVPTLNPSSNTNQCTGLRLNPTFGSNVITLTNLFGLLVQPLTSATPTVNNAYGIYVQWTGSQNTYGAVYGGYFNDPGGTAHTALYTDNFSVGYTAITPPTHGAIISGQVAIGTSSPVTNAGLTAQKAFSPSAGANAYSIYSSPTITSPAGGLANVKAVNSILAIAGAGTVTTAIGVNVDPITASGATITTAIGGYFWKPTNGTNKIALYTDDLSIGYGTTTPPTNGAIISGNTSIGSTSANSLFNVGSSNQTQINSTGLVGIGSAPQTNIALYNHSALTASSGALNSYNSDAKLGATSSNTVSAAYQMYLNPDRSNNAGTITNSYGLFIDTGSGTGTVTTAYSLYVSAPGVGAGTSYVALFAGSTGNVIVDAVGHLYPSNTNNQDLGQTTNRWATVYSKNALSVGTSRLAKSQRSCPTCGEVMMRGTGTLVILGEIGDYIPCWCCNDLCSHKGMTFMDELKHLPSSNLALRRHPPKIEFLGFKVVINSGNSRVIVVQFKYVDAVPGSDNPKDVAKTNATALSDVEYEEFIALTEEGQRDYLYNLGLREWYSLEELRLMTQEGRALESKLQKMTAKWRNTDLMQR